MVRSSYDGKGKLVEQVIDHGDGTGTRTTYRPDGTVLATTPVTGLAVDPPDEVTRRTIEDRAVTALDANAAFLALASPTNAQVLTQVKVLTRECTAVIRLLLGRLDSTTGT